jgi:hypothetical protein
MSSRTEINFYSVTKLNKLVKEVAREDLVTLLNTMGTVIDDTFITLDVESWDELNPDIYFSDTLKDLGADWHDIIQCGCLEYFDGVDAEVLDEAREKLGLCPYGEREEDYIISY